MSAKVWLSADGFDYISLTKKHYDGAMNVMKNGFFRDENVCIGVELNNEPGADDELLELCRRAAKDGVSIVAVEKSTGIVAGASVNKLQVPAKKDDPDFFTRFAANCRFHSSRALVEFMIESDASVNLFEHHNTDCLLELMFVATLPEYRKKGICQNLMKTSIQLAKMLHAGENVKVPITDDQLPLEPVPKVVSAIFTSSITQHIGQKLGFVKNAEISFEHFMFKGKTFASRIGKSTLSTTVESIKL